MSALPPIAMITAANRTEPYAAAHNGRTWEALDSAFCVDEPVTLRHLLVIDPEDRSQVEALRDALRDEPGPVGYGWRWVQKAVRSLATPKPSEPFGIGAVVEDVDGARWVRINDVHWHSESSPNNRQTYSEITAVRVLARGWSA